MILYHKKKKEVIILDKNRDYTIETDFKKNCKVLVQNKLPKWEELPDIGLYMDQLVKLLDKYLSIYNEDNEDKLITRAMINNYVKNGLIPKPEKKLYGRDHIAYLLVIGLLKPILSISNIKEILKCQNEYRDAKEILNLVYNILELSSDFFINKVALKVESLLKVDGNSSLAFTSLAMTMGIISNTSKMVAVTALNTKKEWEEK